MSNNFIEMRRCLACNKPMAFFKPCLNYKVEHLRFFCI